MGHFFPNVAAPSVAKAKKEKILETILRICQRKEKIRGSKNRIISGISQLFESFELHI